MTRRGAQSDDGAARRNAAIAGVLFGLVFAGIGLLLGTLRGVHGARLLLFGAGSGVVAGVIVRLVSYRVAHGMATGVAAFLFPTGAGSPYESTYSSHDAKEAAGDVEGAIAAYEATLLATPGQVRAMRQAAELYVRAGNPARAAELFAEMRRASSAHDAELYATQRLADLYLGPLGNDGKAMVELRRLVERFPGTAEASGALAAIRRLKDARGRDGAAAP